MKFPRATGLRGVPALMVLAMARLVERKPAAQYAVAQRSLLVSKCTPGAKDAGATGRRLTPTPQRQCRKMGWCSRKRSFDELADNLEARSDRYTHQSGPGIIALF